MYNKSSPVLNNRTRTEQIKVSKFKVKSKATQDKKHPSVLDSISHFESHKSFGE